MSSHTHYENFTAEVAIGLGGHGVLLDIDSNVVKEDFLDAPDEWQPISDLDDVPPSVYVLTGTYFYDLDSQDKPVFGTGIYTNLKVIK